MTTVFCLAGAFGDSSLVPAMLRGQVTAGATAVVPMGAAEGYNNDLLWPDETSMAANANALDTMLNGTSGPKVVEAHSLGALVCGRWMNDHGATSALTSDEVSFVLLGNSVRKYGGLIRDSVIGCTPPDDVRFKVTDLARQYDGWADAPAVWDWNSTQTDIAGQSQIHSYYNDIGLDDDQNLYYVEGNITYVLSPTKLLPQLQWAAGIPQFAASLDAQLRPLVEADYKRPPYAPRVATPVTNTTVMALGEQGPPAWLPRPQLCLGSGELTTTPAATPSLGFLRVGTCPVCRQLRPLLANTNQLDRHRASWHAADLA